MSCPILASFLCVPVRADPTSSTRSFERDRITWGVGACGGVVNEALSLLDRCTESPLSRRPPQGLFSEESNDPLTHVVCESQRQCEPSDRS